MKITDLTVTMFNWESEPWMAGKEAQRNPQEQAGIVQRVKPRRPGGVVRLGGGEIAETGSRLIHI